VVDGEGVPVGLGEGEQAAAAQDAMDLGQYRSGVGDVHEHAVGAGAVDAVCLERQVVRLRLVHLHGRPVGHARAGGLNHLGVLIDAEDRAGRPGCGGQSREVGAGAAADV
jgi:hypothetical protein